MKGLMENEGSDAWTGRKKMGMLLLLWYCGCGVVVAAVVVVGLSTSLNIFQSSMANIRRQRGWAHPSFH